MNNRKNLLAVMDIGSSKINCLQCLTDNNDITKVIGLSTIASKGIVSGVITDFNLAYDSISKAIRECEKQSNESIGELTISIDGKPDIIIPLVAEKNISKVNPFLKIIAAAKYLLFGTSLDEN